MVIRFTYSFITDHSSKPFPIVHIIEKPPAPIITPDINHSWDSATNTKG